ncbi:MAG: hypothetical protein CMJ46_07655 [Planctomyces sp.]|nr:hypothetical protein [Planctomyces sp.]
MSIVTREAVVQKLEELDLHLSPFIDYRLETMFPKLEGMFAKGAIKKKHKLVSTIEPLMEEMLLKNETVLFVSKGNQYSFVERFFMGIWSTTINHTVVILTNLRLLCIRTNGKGKPKKTFWCIYYSQIRDFKSTFAGNAKIILKDGKKLVYSGFPKIDRNKMREVFIEAYDNFESKGFDPEVTQSQERLCGHCFEVVPKGQYQCPSCTATFWTPTEVGVRSLIIPSWGDFVMGHYPIAIAELIGFALVLFVVTGAIMNGDYLFAAFFFFMANVMDAIITAQIAKKGLHLKQEPAPGAEPEPVVRVSRA